MKKYLATLKDKPHHHKQRFALLVSGDFHSRNFCRLVVCSFSPIAGNCVNFKTNRKRTGTSFISRHEFCLRFWGD